ncbi:chaperone DnaJ domain protein [Parvibaculum lavamentivorans DS-1]|uniref:Chaperone DnaJ domain protein n=2 Tax=Parvibaculum lavamentivorans TaxID=256618 RepID=A7HRR4_PARL1|nr:chaperone DnaJ domain protein [Parvibaculum lavamentivorans DS-1]
MSAMDDPYETLGVARTASEAEIKSAFKKLARKLHPDLHPGDKAAEAQFKSVSAAYDLLKDSEKRRRFDAGEIDAGGAERPQERYYRDFADAGFAGGPGAHAAGDGFASNEDLNDFFARAFGEGGAFGGARRRGAEFKARGQDVSYTLPVSFLDAAKGAVRTLTMPDGKTLNVTIPEGAEDRQMLRLKGQGMPGFGGGPAGDAYVELHVTPHAFFRRKDDNIHVEIPVTLKEAVLGARIEVPTIAGPVAMTIPKGSNTGKVLRLRDKGVKNRKSGVRGHQMVTLKVVLPEGEEPALAEFLESWEPRTQQDPRKEMLP